MMEEKNNDILYPLHKTENWKEANLSVKHHLNLYKNRISGLKNCASELKYQYESIIPILDDLCQKTCGFCPDTCCLNAKVWFDLKDILFIHLTDQKIPGNQLIKAPDEKCSYIGYKGCTLPRISRAFTCTLYICHTQLQVLRQENGREALLKEALDKIKVLRNQLESEFIYLIK